MKLLAMRLLLFVCFTGTSLWVRSAYSLGEHHPYYRIEKEVREMSLEKLASSGISIPENASVSDYYSAIFKLMRLLASQIDLPKNYPLYDKTISAAFQHYPNEQFFRLMALEGCHLGRFPGYERKAYHITGDEFASTLANLVMFLARQRDFPRVNYSIYRFFSFINNNFNEHHIAQNNLVRSFYNYAECCSSSDREKIELMMAFWCCICYDNGLRIGGEAKATEDYNKAKAFLDVDGNHEKAFSLWQKLVLSAMTQYGIDRKILNKKRQKNGVSMTSFGAKGEKSGVNTNDLSSLLSELESKRRMDLMELEVYFGRALSRFSAELKGSPDLPNLGKIRENHSEREAAVLNLWYKFAICGGRQDVYDLVGGIEGWEKDSRLVFLRLVCARDLKHDKDEQKRLSDTLVRLEPKSERFRHLQLSMALAPAEGVGKTPDAPSPELSSLVKRKYANADEALAELESHRQWSLQALELYFGKLSDFRKQLRGNADLPNLDKVKAVNGDYEAVVLNLWYKYDITRQYQDVYDAIGGVSGWEKDVRLVFLKLLCGHRLSIAKEEMLKLCDILIALEPDNPRFKHVKLSFEMK